MKYAFPELINFAYMRRQIVSLCIFCIAIIFFHSKLSAQNVNVLVIENTFADYKLDKPHSPKPIALRKKSFVAKLNPFHYGSAGLMFFYQSVLSEQIQANCNYEISCSNYTKKCIEKFGLVKGVLLGFDQLTNCSVSTLYDFPAYKISQRSKIINAIEE